MPNVLESDAMMSKLFRKPSIIAASALFFMIIAGESRSWLHKIPIYHDAIGKMPDLLRWLEQPVLGLAICLLGLFVVHRAAPWKGFREMGLHAPVHVGLAFGLLATLPMIVASLIWGKLAADLDPLNLLLMAGVYPMAEEIVYRGYTFRQLHRRAKWNLWVAAIGTGVIFGAAHLANASVRGMDPMDQMGTVALISVGGILFAWLFVKWEDNLWVPFALHAFMNLWWSVFELANDPLGGWGANVMRLLTVVLAVVLTIYRKKVLAMLRIGASDP